LKVQERKGPRSQTPVTYPDGVQHQRHRPFLDHWPAPQPLDEAGLARICEARANVAKRADRRGFGLVFEPGLRWGGGTGGLCCLYCPRREG
jgi:hypothetical protein